MIASRNAQGNTFFIVRGEILCALPPHPKRSYALVGRNLFFAGVLLQEFRQLRWRFRLGVFDRFRKHRTQHVWQRRHFTDVLPMVETAICVGVGCGVGARMITPSVHRIDPSG